MIKTIVYFALFVSCPIFSQIVFTVSTDKMVYQYGDTVTIVSSLNNIGSNSDTLHFSGCVAKLIVDSFDVNNIIICPGIAIRIVLNSNDVASQEFQIPGYFNKILSLGSHKIICHTTNYGLADTVIIDVVNSPTNIQTHDNSLRYYSLDQNYPNPFNPSTTFTFSIPVSEHISLKVINLMGIEISTVTEGIYTSGTHKVEWNASNYPSGVYFYKLHLENYSITKKLLLLK